MASVAWYTLARLALFGAALGVLYLLGARGVLLVVLALLISGLVSVIALSRQRDRMSVMLSQRYRRLRERIHGSDDGAAEDPPDDGPDTRDRR